MRWLRRRLKLPEVEVFEHHYQQHWHKHVAWWFDWEAGERHGRQTQVIRMGVLLSAGLQESVCLGHQVGVVDPQQPPVQLPVLAVHKIAVLSAGHRWCAAVCAPPTAVSTSAPCAGAQGSTTQPDPGTAPVETSAAQHKQYIGTGEQSLKMRILSQWSVCAAVPAMKSSQQRHNVLWLCYTMSPCLLVVSYI
jgi:hypothetical protein